jgi:hypothetical protein
MLAMQFITNFRKEINRNMLNELFEIFENKKHNRSDHHGRPLDVDHRAEDHLDNHHSDYREQRGYSHNSDFGHKRVADLLHNKKIMVIALIMAPMAILLLGCIGILIFPTISHIWEVVSTNGIKGIIEAAVPFVRQLWEGGKG